jgi:hypothetical protein
MFLDGKKYRVLRISPADQEDLRSLISAQERELALWLVNRLIPDYCGPITSENTTALMRAIVLGFTDPEREKIVETANERRYQRSQSVGQGRPDATTVPGD